MAGDDLFGWSGDEGLEPECAYFFALMPKGPTQQQIGERRESAIRARSVGRASPVDDHRLHLSLCAPKTLKRLRAPFEQSLQRAGAEVKASAFGLRLDGFDTFNGGFGQPCRVLRSDAASSTRVQALKDSLGRALFNQGFGWDGGTLAPHVTLFYADHLESPYSPAEAVEWHVDEFVLVRSRVGKHRHDIIGRWPLH
ncbi:2'-5' RNA ligase family protein [Dyella sp. EPa41]|uniref:2'-5' RNA ligase family protein n=1 Tax=Dyella sp. EPa41 TaxID=1561194 RepID=UPI00191537C9|nr:2'-5' RNA ligase family protein [Dyella sp. EPa41]